MEKTGKTLGREKNDHFFTSRKNDYRKNTSFLGIRGLRGGVEVPGDPGKLSSEVPQYNPLDKDSRGFGV